MELLNKVENHGSMPDHKLELKKGYIVLLLRNIITGNRYCNDTRYVVDGMSTEHNLLYPRVAGGPFKRRRLCLPRIPCKSGECARKTSDSRQRLTIFTIAWVSLPAYENIIRGDIAKIQGTSLIVCQPSSMCCIYVRVHVHSRDGAYV